MTPKIGLSLTPNSAQTVWTLTLRPGVKFSDGTPYDAAAVEFNWARDKASTSALVGRRRADQVDEGGQPDHAAGDADRAGQQL